MRELDATDRQLIALLRHDGRAAVTNLAGDLGLSRATVQNRINRLVAAGVIRKFTVELGMAMEDHLVCAVTRIELQAKLLEQVKRELKKVPEITSLYTTNGRWGLVAHTTSQNLDAFDRLLAHIGAIKGVLRAETSLLLSKVV